MTNQTINQSISDLLCEHNCVVVPNFGGFVANYSSAHIDHTTNYMFAPKKSIVFNRSLQNNDGLLVNEIALCNRLTFKQAQKELDVFVQELNESLRLYKKVYIDKVGTLLLTSENNILFVQSDSRNHLLDSFGFTTMQYPVIERGSKLEKKIRQLDQTHIPGNKKSWLRVAAVLIPLLMLSALGVSNKDRVTDTYANLFPFNTSTINVETSPSSATSYEVFSPTSSFSGTQLEFLEDQQDLAPSIAIEDEVNYRYYIIAGAFSSKKNAERMVNTLKQNGYRNAQVVGRSHSGLYRVAYNGFFRTSDALIALEASRTENPKAWLLNNK